MIRRRLLVPLALTAILGSSAASAYALPTELHGTSALSTIHEAGRVLQPTDGGIDLLPGTDDGPIDLLPGVDGGDESDGDHYDDESGGDHDDRDD